MKKSILIMSVIFTSIFHISQAFIIKTKTVNFSVTEDDLRNFDRLSGDIIPAIKKAANEKTQKESETIKQLFEVVDVLVDKLDRIADDLEDVLDGLRPQKNQEESDSEDEAEDDSDEDSLSYPILQKDAPKKSVDQKTGSKKTSKI